jgi:hypothetical protein
MSAIARAMDADARFKTGSIALRRISSMELLVGGLAMISPEIEIDAFDSDCGGDV